MAKYIVQHRRGTATQWDSHGTIIPMEGEIVIEIDEENSLHKLKIGDGIHAYSELAYLMAGDEVVTQVLSKALPRVVTVTLDVSKWTEVVCQTDPNLGYYGQTVTLDGVTKYSRLDLQPDADMIAEFKQIGLGFVAENKSGVITVYSTGNMPLKTYTMQATIIETELEVASDKVVGIPVGVPPVSTIGGGVGEATSNGGEIFNDYENNIAGGRGFKITAKNGPNSNGDGYYVLEGYSQYIIDHPELTPYAAGDIWSAHIKNAYDFRGAIIYTDGDTVYVSNYVEGATDTDPWTFWVHTKPTFGNIAIGDLAHAEGKNTTAIGQAAHAEGRDTVANENYAHAEGRQTKAAYAGHSEGRITEARGMYGHAENFRTVAGDSAHAEGSYRVALAEHSHAEGLGRKNTAVKDQYGGNPADETIGALGKASHVEGIETTAIGEGAHAEGYNTIAQNNYSHSEGYYNRITKDVYTPLDLASGTPNNSAGVFINDKGQVEYDLDYTDVSNLVTMRHFGFAETFSGLVTLQFNLKSDVAFAYNLYAISGLDKVTATGGKTGKGSGTAYPANGYVTITQTINFNDKTKPYLSFRLAENKGVTNTITLLSTNIITEEIDTDIIHSIGNGTSDTDRSNAFVVYKDGHAELGAMGETDNSVATKKYIDKEIATFDFIKIVNSLDSVETPLVNRIYLVPKTEAGVENKDLFDEYLWIDQTIDDTVTEPHWEWIATKQIEVDLANYATKTYVKTEIAIGNSTKADLINGKVPIEQLPDTSKGMITQIVTSLPDVSDASENIIYILKKDELLAFSSTATFIFDEGYSDLSIGENTKIIYNDAIYNEEENSYTVYFEQYYGRWIFDEGFDATCLVEGNTMKFNYSDDVYSNVRIYQANYEEYLLVNDKFEPIGPNMENYATKDDLNKAIGDIEAVLDSIITAQESYIGGDA